MFKPARRESIETELERDHLDSGFEHIPSHNMAPVQSPKSYTELSKSFGHIKVSHVPENAPEATPVVLLTLNRPDKGNAFTTQMQQEICAAYEYFEHDARVKVVVLTGAGKAFCFGADLEIGFLGGASKSGAQNAGNAKTERDVGKCCTNPCFASMC